MVIAGKSHQEDVPWDEYKWRLCVSYRRLNQVTRPFAYPIPRCDDAVEEIPSWAKYFIAIDLDSGYWQIQSCSASRHKLAFFVSHGKKTWMVMPMGTLNSAPVFVCMMDVLAELWDEEAEQLKIPLVGVRGSGHPS